MGGLDLLVVNTGGPPGGTFETVGEAETAALIHRIKHMNPRAPQRKVHFGEVPIAEVFDLRGFNLNAKLDIDPEFLNADGGHDQRKRVPKREVRQRKRRRACSQRFGGTRTAAIDEHDHRNVEELAGTFGAVETSSGEWPPIALKNGL